MQLHKHPKKEKDAGTKRERQWRFEEEEERENLKKMASMKVRAGVRLPITEARVGEL